MRIIGIGGPAIMAMSTHQSDRHDSPFMLGMVALILGIVIFRFLAWPEIRDWKEDRKRWGKR